MKYTYEIVMHTEGGRSTVAAKGTMDEEGYKAFLALATVTLDVEEWNALHGIKEAP